TSLVRRMARNSHVRARAVSGAVQSTFTFLILVTTDSISIEEHRVHRAPNDPGFPGGSRSHKSAHERCAGTGMPSGRAGSDFRSRGKKRHRENLKQRPSPAIPPPGPWCSGVDKPRSLDSRLLVLGRLHSSHVSQT